MDFPWVALIVALVGGGGLAVAIREIVNVITLARSGVSGKEDKRKADIATQRDYYAARVEDADRDRDDAERHRDAERNRRRIMEDELALARRRMMEAGLDPRPWPHLDEDTEPPRPRP